MQFALNSNVTQLMESGMQRLKGEKLSAGELTELRQGIFSFADKVNQVALYIMFLFGAGVAFYYDTWLVAIGVGGLCLIAYFSTKKLLPDSDLYQYVLSGICAIFAAQFIYQMHGMAEMHFWVFISSTILIIYQNWRLQIPLIVIVVIHHATFAWLQYSGYKEIYFTRLDYMDLTTFIFHGVLAACVCGVSAYWSYVIYKRTVQDAMNLKMQLTMKAELQEKNEELTASEEELRASQEELMASQEELTQINENLNNLVKARTLTILDQNKKFVQHAFINAHKVRSPLARIQGLVNLMNYEAHRLTAEGQEVQRLLKLSSDELDAILREVRANLDGAEFTNLSEGFDNGSSQDPTSPLS
jgi:signal transduction histidine kinase